MTNEQRKLLKEVLDKSLESLESFIDELMQDAHDEGYTEGHGEGYNEGEAAASEK